MTIADVHDPYAGADPHTGHASATGQPTGDAAYLAEWAEEFDARAAADEYSSRRRPQGDREDLDVTNPAIAADWLRATIGRGRLAGLFDRSGQAVLIAREGEAGYTPPARDSDHDGPAQVRTVTPAALAAYIDARYECQKIVTVKDEETVRPALFPLEAAKRIVDLPDPALRPGLRRLAGVVHTPVVRADGSILGVPGYDPPTLLYHLPDPGLTVPPVPDRPTDNQIRAAVALLSEMTDGFPWKTEHDQAGYFGFLLTPLLRNLVPPPYKAFVFDAPQQGTGKTLLAKVGNILHGGVLRGGLQHSDDAEVRKVITTVLARTTGPVVILDNLTGVLDSPVLAGLLTSPDWSDRLLGATEEIRAVNDRVWTVTANNLAVGSDMVRRVVWCGIDARMSRPQDRTDFAIADLEGWVRQRRGAVLHALLTLIRAWVQAGRPVQPARTSDSFATWVQAVDGILTHAGVPGRFADPATTRQETSGDDEEWGAFLSAAYALFGTDTWTVKELLARVSTGDAGGLTQTAWPQAAFPLDALPGDLADKASRHARGPVGVARSLGMWLSHRDGRYVGHLCARSPYADRKDVKMWRIDPISTDSGAGTAGTAGTSSGHLTVYAHEANTNSNGGV
jgi:hypothetical protein